jgi:hypothetical protein
MPTGGAVSCEWGVLASAYFDNELGLSKNQWFEEHLFSCPESSLDLEAFRIIQRVIRSIQLEGDAYPSNLFEDSTCS